MGMIPIGDDDSDRTITPFVNYLLIAANIAVFVLLQGMGANDRFTYAFSTVPQEIVSGRDIVTSARTLKDPASGQSFQQPGLQPTPITVYLTLLIAVFMHGGIPHLAGNMLYLWIFGDNIENALGHVRYLVFYLVCGVLASLAHVFTTAATHGNMLVPSLGASGAISGVLGGYLLLFPGRRVRVMMGRGTTEMPALVSIGGWFLFQVVAGMGLLGGGSQAGGVAYAAHVGGFIAGLILVKMFAVGQASR
jgi:membrane associated rhomboid family serine protease